MLRYLLRGLLIGLALSVLSLFWSVYTVIPFGADAVKWAGFQSLLITILLVGLSVGFSFTYAQIKLREGGKKLSSKDFTVERLVLVAVGLLFVILTYVMANFEYIVDGIAGW